MRISAWSSDVCSSDLQHRAEASGGGVDLRLGFGLEADHLGVAATLEIEHAVGAPAVLVVADQAAAGARGKRRSEERRAGEERVSTCCSRWSAYQSRKTDRYTVNRQPITHAQDN